jgi:phytanoyl-CoA hydroxylase
MAEIVQSIDIKGKSQIAVFSTENSNKQKRDDYFLDSAWQIFPFFESDALDAEGNLLVDKSVAFNKVGHNMHELDPVFETFSFSKMVRSILFKAMKF